MYGYFTTVDLINSILFYLRNFEKAVWHSRLFIELWFIYLMFNAWDNGALERCPCRSNGLYYGFYGATLSRLCSTGLSRWIGCYSRPTSDIRRRCVRIGRGTRQLRQLFLVPQLHTQHRLNISINLTIKMQKDPTWRANLFTLIFGKQPRV